MDALKVLGNIVRVGAVSAVDGTKQRARVQYDDIGIVSGWLYVLQHGASVDVAFDGGHTHIITDIFTQGGSASSAPAHNHAGSKLGGWAPKVNDRVLVLYIPVANGDGFILGRIP